MKFSTSFKFGKKVAPIDLSASEQLAAAAPREPIQTLPLENTGSSSSIRSNASSKKAAQILGVEAPVGEHFSSIPATSSRSSLLKYGIESGEDSDSESESEYEIDSGSASEQSSIMGSDCTPHATSSYEDNSDSSVDLSASIEKCTTNTFDGSTMSTTSSPDIDVLEVGQFPFNAQSQSSYDPNVSVNAQSATLVAPGSGPQTVDFEEVCERLRDTLILPEMDNEQESFDKCLTNSTVSSSHSSAMLFTEPSTPSLSSSASSFNSLIDERKLDRMDMTKSALVADQAALEAKLKLAAARDALKKVKCNVVSPMAPGLGPQVTRPIGIRPSSIKTERPTHSRSLSGTVSHEKPSLSGSRSYGDVSKLQEEFRTPRSTRSSRNIQRDEHSLAPMKSTVKIGFAAPKDLSVLRHPSEPKRPALSHVKGRSKSQVYVPQHHITSIHEVLA